MTSHLEKNLQREIDLIRSKVLEMGGLVENAVKGSLQALVEDSRQGAYLVILRDQYIDELEKELDRLCLEFLLRQQPVAGHLRFVYATIKINNELERIGDYAESIARQSLLLGAMAPLPPYGKFVEIANISIPMLHNAVQAFADQDVELARKAMEFEGKVDTIRNSIHADLVNLRQAGKFPLEALAPLMIIASRFERVADQSCNICEEVLYMCTGEYFKHKGTEAFRVLFLDDGNCCVSQIAEAIGGSLGLSKFVFSSAGTSPRQVDQRTIAFLRGKGLDISHPVSKPINQIPHFEHYQVIIALCDAAQAALPQAPTRTVSIDWKISDPSRLEGNLEDVCAEYEKTFQYLDTHIRDLVHAILGDEKR